MRTDEPTVEMIDGFDPAELEEQDSPAEPEAKTDADDPDKKPTKKEDDPVVAELRRQNKALIREQRRILETITNRPAPAAPAKKDEPEEEAQLSVDLVEAITAGDQKKIRQALNEMGFVSKKDMDAKVAAVTASIATETQLYRQYPELADEKSEFFKLTGEIYRELEKDGVTGTAGIKLAARQAKAELKAAGKDGRSRASLADRFRGTRDEDADDDDNDDVDDDAEERDRVRRVGRQSGDGVRRRVESRTGGSGGNNTELTAMQKRIVDNLRAAGGNISYETYGKRAASGVRLSGRPSRGR